jgi:hypothetical protein
MTEKPKRGVPFMLRLSVEEKNLLDDAARYEGFPTGTWSRSVLIKAARDILKKIVNRPPEIRPGATCMDCLGRGLKPDGSGGANRCERCGGRGVEGRN